MVREYRVERKLQEQSGSYFVVLPKIWVEAQGLEQGDQMSVIFNGIVKIKPPSVQPVQSLHGEGLGNCSSGSSVDAPLSREINPEGGDIV